MFSATSRALSASRSAPFSGRPCGPFSARSVGGGITADVGGGALGGRDDALHLRPRGGCKRRGARARVRAHELLDAVGYLAQVRVDGGGVIAAARDGKVATFDRVAVDLHCRAIVASAGRATSGRASARGRLGRVDLAQVAAQVAQLVADLRGVLEAQLLGGELHLLLELYDHALELVSGELAARGAAPAPAFARARDLGLRVEELGDVGDALDDGRRRDAVLLVVGELDFAPAVGLLDRGAHRARLFVGVHQNGALDVARGAADRLD